MARRQHVTLTLLAVTVFLSLVYFMSGGRSKTEYEVQLQYDDFGPSDYDTPAEAPSGSDGLVDASKPSLDLSDRILTGGSIAPKLANATAKYVALSSLPSSPLVANILVPYLPRRPIPLLTLRLFQSRTRPSVLETPAHDDGALSGHALRGRQPGTQDIHPAIRAAVPLRRVRCTLPEAAA